MNKALYSTGVLLVSLLTLSVSAGRQGDPQPPPQTKAMPTAAPVRPGAGFGEIPLQFIPNRGQTANQVAFYVQGRDKTVFFAEDGLTFALGADSPGRWVVKLDFVDPNDDVRLV